MSEPDDFEIPDYETEATRQIDATIKAIRIKAPTRHKMRGDKVISSPNELKIYCLKAPSGKIITSDYVARSEKEVWQVISTKQPCDALKPHYIQRLKDDGFYIEEMKK